MWHIFSSVDIAVYLSIRSWVCYIHSFSSHIYCYVWWPQWHIQQYLSLAILHIKQLVWPMHDSIELYYILEGNYLTRYDVLRWYSGLVEQPADCRTFDLKYLEDTHTKIDCLPLPIRVSSPSAVTVPSFIGWGDNCTVATYHKEYTRFHGRHCARSCLVQTVHTHVTCYYFCISWLA